MSGKRLFAFVLALGIGSSALAAETYYLTTAVAPNADRNRPACLRVNIGNCEGTALAVCDRKEPRDVVLYACRTEAAQGNLPQGIYARCEFNCR